MKLVGVYSTHIQYMMCTLCEHRKQIFVKGLQGAIYVELGQQFALKEEVALSST